MKFSSGHYCGQTLKKTEASGLRLMETECRPNVRWTKHSHASACLSVTLQGRMSETYSKRTLHYKPLNFAFNLPDEEHSARVYEAGARFLIIELDNDWLTRVRKSSPLFHNSAVMQIGTLLPLAMSLRQELHQAGKVSPYGIEELVLEIIAETSRDGAYAEHYRPRWLERAKELIHANYDEPLSLSGVAGSVGVHPVHLARVFRQFERCTVGEYIRKLRIEAASRELSSLSMSLSEIAAATGFFDQGHFCRIFKQHTSMTPAQYRNSLTRH